MFKQTNAETLSTKKKLKIHLYQTILGDKFSTKNVEQNPSPKPISKETSTKEILFW